MWEQVERGEAEILCSSCAYAKVLWIRPKHTRIAPRWSLWGRIVQWFGSQPEKWRIFWFPSPSLRQMPAPGEEILPGHVNGGYTIPCTHNKVVVYRKEDAERVLVHELMHAACLDNLSEAIELREARTEFWAELILVALCSKGSQTRAKTLWSYQSYWIVDQNETLRRLYNIKSPKDYVWRYTLGREQIAKQLRVPLPVPDKSKSRSLRLTTPVLG